MRRDRSSIKAKAPSNPCKNSQEGGLEKLKEFSHVLNYFGSNGKYQKFLLYGIVAPISMIVPIINVSSIFIFNVPDHWCHLPENQNLTPGQLEDWKALALPRVTGPDGLERYSHCQMYKDYNSTEVTNCPSGWDFDQSDFSQTMASEFGWVCAKDYYPTTLFTAVQAGFGVGTVIFGLLADKIGRKPVFFGSLTLYLVLRLMSVFIPQYFVPMVIVTFLSSVGFPLMDLMPTMILAEICDDELRSRFFALLNLTYVVGLAAVPYIAKLSRHWFTIALVTVLPSFLIFLSWFYIHESPRWLMSVGRTKQAAEVLLKIAKANGTQHKMTQAQLETILAKISKAEEANSQSNEGTMNSKPNIIRIFSKPRMAKHLILITISWAVSNLIYECITLNTPNMSGDMFFNFFLLAIVEAPACFASGYLIDAIGRRWTAVLFTFLTAVSCFIGAVLVIQMSDTSEFLIIVTFFAKFTVNITYLVAYLQGTELMPTLLRSTGISFANTVSSALAISVPSIVFTTNYFAASPYIAMGFFATLAMVTTSFLPETKHQDLPETIQAANEFGSGIPFWNFRGKTQQGRQPV